jgi:amidohydrolase
MPPPTSETVLDALIEGIAAELPLAVELRHRLHRHPELAHEEHATLEALAEELPVECRPVAGTGGFALVGGDPGVGGGASSSPIAGARNGPVAVRAELDGVPVRERTGTPFSSSGKAMHACGHDVHMAALVALTRAAYALADRLPAPLLALFQPSEEAYPSGAEQLAHGELAEIAPAAVLAAHVHPELAWGSVGLDAGVVNASCDAAEITIEGRPSHGAYPHLGRDPILALAEVIVALHAQVGRRIDPLGAAVLTVGMLEGGSAENVIPPQATARAALRAHSPKHREALRELVKEVSEGVAAAHGCRARVRITAGEPQLENDPAIVSRARELIGASGLSPAERWSSCGSDDFAFFGEIAPVAMAFVGLDGAEGFRTRPLHHPELLVPDAAVGVVARVQATLYVAAAELPAA